MFIKILTIVFMIFVCFILMCCENKKVELPENTEIVQLDKTTLALTIVADSLDVPWDMQYDSNSDAILLSEVAGKIKKLNLTTLEVETLLQIDEVYHNRTLGLLGMALYQNENSQDYLFLCYTTMEKDHIYSKLVRYDYKFNNQLTNPKLLLTINGSTGHNGSRIIITDDFKVLWATGDAASKTFSQDSTSLNGKILRLNIDGSIPDDNPISDSYVYAWGFRNMQGLTKSTDGKIYTSEHGDAIEDEVNLIQPLHNYGWPQIEGMHDTDSELEIASNFSRTEPIRAWTPVIAPAGLAYYGNAEISEWTNSLLLTTLKGQSLRILKLSADGSRIIDESILFSDYLGRLRSVLVVPNGDVYFSTSNRDWNPQPGFPRKKDDMIYKLSPTILFSDTPIVAKKPTTEVVKNGIELYKAYCESCHKENGMGVPSSFPSLNASPAVNGPKEYLLNILLKGISNDKVGKNKYEGAMPSFSFLTNEEVAAIATYIRTHFNNNSPSISGFEVQTNR